MQIHSQNIIDLKFILLFILAAYTTYLFHEFGHWIIGVILGNDMVYSLNYVWPKSGHYIEASHDLYVLIGGPAFTIIQALFCLLIIEKYRSLYIYPFVFFPVFTRYFSLLFGGFSKQDESKISGILSAGTYTVAIIVLFILVLIVTRCSSKLRIGIKDNSYVLVVSTLCQLLVIGTYKLIS
jgi:hypothetical protein